MNKQEYFRFVQKDGRSWVGCSDFVIFCYHGGIPPEMARNAYLQNSLKYWKNRE